MRGFVWHQLVRSCQFFVKTRLASIEMRCDFVDCGHGPDGMAPSAVTTLFEASIPSTSLRPFSRILVGLSRIGDELCFEASSSKVRNIKRTVKLTVGPTLSNEPFQISVWDG